LDLAPAGDQRAARGLADALGERVLDDRRAAWGDRDAGAAVIAR
jgi:hypothetical protein